MASANFEQGKDFEIQSGGSISSVVFNHEGTHVVCGGRDETVRRWRLSDGKEDEKTFKSGKRINVVAVSRDERWILCGMDGGWVVVWDAWSQERVSGANLKGHRDDVDAADISPNSQTFVTGSRDKTAFVWDIATGQKLVGPLRHEGYVEGARFSPQGDRVATATWYGDKSIRIFDSHNGSLLVVIPDSVLSGCSTPIAWTSDGEQIFAVYDGRIKQLHLATGSLVSEWSAHDKDTNASLALANNGEFIAYSTSSSVSLWDVSTHARLGPLIEQTGKIKAIALSPDNTCLAIGQFERKITLKDLRSTLPDFCFVPAQPTSPNAPSERSTGDTTEVPSSSKQHVTSPSSTISPSQIPFMNVIETAFDAWSQNNLGKANAIFTQEISLAPIPNHNLLSNRALLYARLQRWKEAVDDADKSIETQSSVIGYIAKSVALLGDGKVKDGYRVCDLAFTCCDLQDTNFLLLVKSIIICVAGDHEDALSRVGDLISIENDDNPIYNSIKAHIHLLFGDAQLKRGEQDSAIQSFKDAQRLAPRSPDCPRLRMISLVFGWFFEDLGIRAQRGLCEALHTAGRTQEAIGVLREMMNTLEDEVRSGGQHTQDWVTDFKRLCISTLDNIADAAFSADKYDEATNYYARALSGGPVDPAPIFRKWVKARLTSASWKETLSAAIEFSLDLPIFSVYQSICDVLKENNRLTEAIECFHELMKNCQEDETTASDDRHEWELAFRGHCSAIVQKGANTALQSQQYDEAIEQYSFALSLDPPNATALLTKRSEALAMIGSWERALEDAEKVIALEPLSHWGYERMHTALHGAGKYINAVGAYEAMFSMISQSPDPQIRVLCEKFMHPSRMKATIRSVVHPVIRSTPRVLIDTASGRLYDGSVRATLFEASETYHELVSSMTTHIDHPRITKAIREYFRYAMLSHNWDGDEPLFQMVESISVYTLKASPTNSKLQRFCLLVKDLGFRWAWSDTCCIDKKDLVVLQESLVSMFKWYRGSAITVVYLRGVGRESCPGGLVDSTWNSRAWTYQEYVAAEVIQFYTEDWTPYLSMPIFDQDGQFINHKASATIIREMQQAIQREVGDGDWPELQPGLDFIREKLCLASMRQTTFIEDAAYSLFGILSTSIPVIYGEGENALGRFLAQVLMSSREVSILAWTGESSRYNSCLPARIAVFKELATSFLPLPPDGVSMEKTVTNLRTSFPDTTEVVHLYNRLNNLQRPWFAGQCMHLPCITFQVGPTRVDVVGGVYVYRARTIALGMVEIRTKRVISRPNALYLIHPWIHALLDREDLNGSAFPEELGLPLPHPDEDHPAESLSLITPFPAPVHDPPADIETRAFRLVARLQQPFSALVVERSPNAVEYRRVAADTKITVRVQKSTPLTHLLENVRTLEVL